MRKLTALKIAAGVSIAGAATVCIATIAAPVDTSSMYVPETSHAAHTHETTGSNINTNLKDKKANTDVSEDWRDNSCYDNVRNLSEMDRYLLAKLIMAEAEGEPLTTQSCIALVVLNRKDDPGFPDTVRDVIFQEGQFSPLDDGRWEEVEPDTASWAAVNFISTGWDESEGALYFESPSESTWHKDNLNYLFTRGSFDFYTDKTE